MRVDKYFDDIINIPESYVFVAMDFSSKSDHIYNDIICPAVLDAGMMPIRSDRISSLSDQFPEQIERLIQNARFFIADITFARPYSYANIFLELGIAIAFHRPMILMTQDDEIPADVRHLRNMKYDQSEAGKYTAKNTLMSILQKSINPEEKVLRKIFVAPDLANYIIFGNASKEHIREVFPLVDSDYQERLNTRSSEASGISLLTMALQKIGRSMGKEMIDIISVNGYSANRTIFAKGNIFIFGGPGANPLFHEAVVLANSIYTNALNIKYEIVEGGKKRYYIAKAGIKHPQNQYSLYRNKRDIGFVMRFPNPMNDKTAITIGAGIRTYGTEGAIKLLVTPSLISRMSVYLELEENIGFWALIEVMYGDNDTYMDEIKIIDSEILRTRCYET